MTQKPMTKTQLVAAIAEAASVDKSTANRALEALTEVVTNEVAKGGPYCVMRFRLTPFESGIVMMSSVLFFHPASTALVDNNSQNLFAPSKSPLKGRASSAVAVCHSLMPVLVS
jgi:hypothetical protein